MENLTKKGFYSPTTGKLSSNCFLVFLGDYTDRGLQGVELWFELMNLKIVNKDQVILLRGNHEDDRLAHRCGFKYEWFIKFGFSPRAFKGWKLLSDRLFANLPHAAFIGIQDPWTTNFSFLMFTHGGIEPRADIRGLLEKAIENPGAVNYQTIADIGINNGFNWSDLYSQQWTDGTPEAQTRPTKHGTPVPLNDYNKTAAIDYIKTMVETTDSQAPYSFTIQAIVRGHRHVPGGVVELVDPIGDDSMKSYVTVKGSFYEPLKSGVTYPISQHSIYTLTSSPEGLGHYFNCWEDSYSLFYGAADGSWSIIPHIRYRGPKNKHLSILAMLENQFVNPFTALTNSKSDTNLNN